METPTHTAPPFALDRLVRPLPAGSQIEYCDIRASIIRDDGGSSVEVEIPGEGRMSWYWQFQGDECKIIQPNASVEARQ